MPFQIIKYRFGVALALFFSLSANVLAQQNMKCNVGLQQDKMLVGDQQELVIELEYPASATLQHIDFERLDSNTIELIDYILMDSLESSDLKSNRIRATITAFTAGDYKISLPVRIRDGQQTQTIFSDTMHLVVYSPTLDSTTLAPIKDILPEKDDITDWGWIILLIFLVPIVLIGLYVLISSQKKKQTQLGLPSLSAYDSAMKALETLQQSSHLAKGNVKIYYSELSNIVRNYLEKAYQIPALESTSAQILAHEHGNKLSDEQQVLLRKLLSTSDLVKFAKVEPTSETHNNTWETAKQIILLSKG
jgi:hypothetical protein